jgi:hypothetical protein
MDDGSASVVIARYAATPKVELEQTLPLGSEEALIVAVRGATKYSGDSFLGRLNTSTGGRRSFIRLSTTRLCVVRRYGFIRDRIIVIPPSAITGLKEQGPRESVMINFREGLSDRVLTIVTWTQSRTPVDENAARSIDVADSFRHLARVLGGFGSG